MIRWSIITKISVINYTLPHDKHINSMDKSMMSHDNRKKKWKSVESTLYKSLTGNK